MSTVDTAIDLETLKQTVSQLKKNRIGRLVMACHRENLETARNSMRPEDELAFRILCQLSYSLFSKDVIDVLNDALKD